MSRDHHLVILSGPGEGTQYALEKAEILIGRDTSNDIVIAESEVSRRHARLVTAGDEYKLEDFGSTNGTFLNEERLSAALPLKPGDIITLGEKVILRYDDLDVEVTAVVHHDTQPGKKGKDTASNPPKPSDQPAAPQPKSSPAMQVPVVPADRKKPAEPPKKITRLWIWILLILVGVILVFCVIPWIIIDATRSYCAVAPGITNLFFPGYCS